MEEFIQSTLQNYFSVVVAAFLLLRMEGEMKALRDAIDRLRYSVGKLSEQHDSLRSSVAYLCQACRFSPVVTAEAIGVTQKEGEKP